MAQQRKICSCCGQAWPQTRTVKLANLVRAFEAIHQVSQGKFQKIEAFKFAGTHAQLKYWGVIEDQKYVGRDGETRTRSGVWRSTDLGRAWFEGRTTLPSEAYVRLDQVERFGPLRLSFADAMILYENPERVKDMEEAQWEKEWMAEQVRENRSYVEEEE